MWRELVDPLPHQIEAVYSESAHQADLTRVPVAHKVSGVLGETPIQQFLVDFPGGRKQVHALTWDPHQKEWFNVFGDEEMATSRQVQY